MKLFAIRLLKCLVMVAAIPAFLLMLVTMILLLWIVDKVMGDKKSKTATKEFCGKKSEACVSSSGCSS